MANREKSTAARARRRRRARRARRARILAVLATLFALVFCFSAYRAGSELIAAYREKQALNALSALVAQHSDDAPPEPSAAPGGEDGREAPGGRAQGTAGAAESVILPQYASLYEMNHDLFGWISIEGTVVDYPVVYTPDRPEYYLKRGFDGKSAASGLPFIDERCPADGCYYLIHGHHMKNRTMFGILPSYADRAFYEEHPVIRFDTIHERREYQVMAAFYSRVYETDEEGVFRYYSYTDLEDPETFEEYVRLAKAAAIFDTGVTAQYGDELIALSTCNYHTAEGRFVVVAKRVG